MTLWLFLLLGWSWGRRIKGHVGDRHIRTLEAHPSRFSHPPGFVRVARANDAIIPKPSNPSSMTRVSDDTEPKASNSPLLMTESFENTPEEDYDAFSLFDQDIDDSFENDLPPLPRLDYDTLDTYKKSSKTEYEPIANITSKNKEPGKTHLASRSYGTRNTSSKGDSPNLPHHSSKSSSDNKQDKTEANSDRADSQYSNVIDTWVKQGNEDAFVCGTCPLGYLQGGIKFDEPKTDDAKCLCGWDQSEKDLTCSQDKHNGPFLISAPVYLGLCNQWLDILGGVYFAEQSWKYTNGTLILPGVAGSRADSNLTQFHQVNFGLLFDTAHIIRSMQRDGVKACLPSQTPNPTLEPDAQGPLNYVFNSPQGHPLIELIDIMKDVNWNVQDPRNDAYGLGNLLPEGKTGSILMKTGLNPLDPSHCWRCLTNNSAGYYHPKRVATRRAANAMCFAKPIRRAAFHILSCLRKKNKPIIGLHARLEDDWVDFLTHNMSLKQQFYDERLQYYKKSLDKISSDLLPSEGGLIYIASGLQNRSVFEKTFESLATGRGYTLENKYTACTGRVGEVMSAKLASVEWEERAAVDAEVIVHTDHFIGEKGSSFSYIIAERRKALARPNANDDHYTMLEKIYLR
ncbi:hypothetical protein AAMO2058_000283600 [Amorphochlora amoebiformis]